MLKEEEERKRKGELPSVDEKPVLSKEEAYKIWGKSLELVPSEFNFIIKTYNDG